MQAGPVGRSESEFGDRVEHLIHGEVEVFHRLVRADRRDPQHVLPVEFGGENAQEIVMTQMPGEFLVPAGPLLGRVRDEGEGDNRQAGG